nr:hypothetical protein [Tanacetum cinerariifolium]
MAPLTFADTHNMIAFLTKSDASEGFDQIVDFLTPHTLQYALMVNPTIYVSCIKQFWALVLIKKSNDAVKLQALIDRKKIFAELAWMGYEKPSTKLTFYKAFLSAQWKFLIHMIVQSMSAKRTTWNEFSSSMASVVICLATVMINSQVDDLSSHNTKYTSPAFTHNVFANMRKIVKGFLGVETPLFDNMLVQQQVQEDAEVAEDEDNETCATLTQKVAHLEQDKVSQALKITKLKQRVKKLEKNRKFKSSSLKRLKKVGGGGITELDANEDVTLVDVDVDTQGRIEEDVTAVKDINAVESEPTVFDDEEVQPIFEREYKHVQTFLKSDRDEEPTKKRPAKETLLQESFKKLRAEVEVLEFKVEALQVKYTLIDWEIYSEGSRTYWRMIRVGEITQAFQSFEDMLKDFDRDDLDALWRITKEKFSTTMPTHVKEKALWTELTRLYKPNADDTLIKMKAEKARIFDEQMEKRLQDKEIEQAAARER